MSDDSLLASGASSEEMFANSKPDAATKEAERAEERKLADILPKARDELAALDTELAKLDTLRDFLTSLGAGPANASEEDIRVQLEARRRYMNYLIGRRNLIVFALVEEGGADPDEFTRKQLPFVPYEPPVIEESRPKGWAAIRAGIGDLLRGS